MKGFNLSAANTASGAATTNSSSSNATHSDLSQTLSIQKPGGADITVDMGAASAAGSVGGAGGGRRGNSRGLARIARLVGHVEKLQQKQQQLGGDRGVGVLEVGQLDQGEKSHR